MGVARQWTGRHDDQCEDPEVTLEIQCGCLDRFIDAHTPAKRNLHVLIVKEEGVVIETGAWATHTDMLEGFVDFVVEVAQPNTELDEELRALSLKVDSGAGVEIRDVIERGLSYIDLIDWWITRREGNEARTFEVKDRT